MTIGLTIDLPRLPETSESTGQLIHAVGNRELHIVGIGSVETDRENVIMKEGREWHDLLPLFCSSLINLNLTPWPHSCHHRLFQIAVSGAFILSDWREDALTLFEPDVEAVYFKSLDKLPVLLDRFVNAPEDCQKMPEPHVSGSWLNKQQPTAWRNLVPD